eukprot:536843-Amorphochlora_amoeboformis.AAC.1
MESSNPTAFKKRGKKRNFRPSGGAMELENNPGKTDPSEFKREKRGGKEEGRESVMEWPYGSSGPR